MILHFACEILGILHFAYEILQFIESSGNRRICGGFYKFASFGGLESLKRERTLLLAKAKSSKSFLDSTELQNRLTN